MDQRCGFLDCRRPSIVTLKNREYCTVHFILSCYQYLEAHSGPQKIASDARQDVLIEIVDQATSLSLSKGNLGNQVRGQLLDVVLWASDLIRDGK
jgi:hypothetical protein